VPGNHDKDWNNKLVQGTFIVEQPITVLKIDGRKYVLSHFPMADWQSMSHESIHLHGHIHSEGSLYNEMNRMQGLYRYDVGVDAVDPGEFELPDQAKGHARDHGVIDDTE